MLNEPVLLGTFATVVFTAGWAFDGLGQDEYIACILCFSAFGAVIAGIVSLGRYWGWGSWAVVDAPADAMFIDQISIDSTPARQTKC